MKILVTGANGFVGQRLSAILARAGHEVRAAVRSSITSDQLLEGVTVFSIGDFGPSTEWDAPLKGTEAIIHLAARVHVMKEPLKHPLAEYRRVNVEGTRRLAMTAARSGVRRFVYVSTIKVNGENTADKPFSEDDAPSPHDAYAVSKLEAEEALQEISSRTGLEVVIIRPPLVYGPGVKGNMLSLMRYIDRGYPLPFGGINNRRSFISLDNLSDVLSVAAIRAECAGRTFLVSDNEDISTRELIRHIAAAMNMKVHLINIPEKVFSIAEALLPIVRPLMSRVKGSLVIDSTRFRRVTGWGPIQTVNDGIRAMVSDYITGKHQ